MRKFLSAKLCKGFTCRIMASFASYVNVTVLIQPLPRANLPTFSRRIWQGVRQGVCKKKRSFELRGKEYQP
ncbi:MAG TPA: hypothetical protein VG722_05350 [Tepidisphaeraceae bacterium]|nr:hypothetical protein [Tepidisphaeraceae bacterium]